MLKRGDMVYSHWDRDEGRVTRNLQRGVTTCHLDLTLSKVTGASRETAKIFKRIYSGDRVRTHVIRSTNNLGFQINIIRYPFRHLVFPQYHGFYYWLTSQRRQYNPSGGFTVTGVADEDLVAASVDGCLVYKRDIGAYLPEEPTLGIEELYGEVVDIEQVIPELER